MNRLHLSVFVIGICSVIVRAQPAPEARRPGLTLHVYDTEDLSQLPQLVPNQTPNHSRYIETFDLGNGDFGAGPELDDTFLAEAFGYLSIDVPGEYEFELISDDGSELLIDDRVVVLHDGLHGADASQTGRLRLEPGVHSIRARVFEAWGDARLRVRWKKPGDAAWSVVPSSSLFTQADVVHVTSPGQKKVVLPTASNRPGDGRPLVDVHPSFRLTDLLAGTGLEAKVGGIDFLPNGELIFTTWDARGDVYILPPMATVNRGGEVRLFPPKLFATGLAEPLGIKVVGDRVFVLQKQELTELIDHDQDGVADEYRCVSDDWPVTGNFHEFAFGLAYAEGAMYANLAVAINPGGRNTVPQIAHDPETLVGRGQVVRIDIETGKVTPVAMGIRTPNGIGFGPEGQLLVTDNQGDWLPCSKLLEIPRDRFDAGLFFGAHTEPDHAWATREVTPPLAWLPQGEIGNSPSQPDYLRVGPWQGQIIHGDVTHGGIKRTFVDEVTTADGTPVRNGCVYRFSQGFAGGVNRIAWGPDGKLYVGQIGSTGNWGQAGKQWFGLQSLEYTGASAFEILRTRLMRNGIELEFTEPLALRAGWEPTDWRVSQYRYAPSADYGGVKLDETSLPVKSASVSADRRRVFLELDGLMAGHVVHVRGNDTIRSDAGEPLWSTELWYTINGLPADRAGEVLERPDPNRLTEDEVAAGWQSLFDGLTKSGWRSGDGWQVVDGALVRVVGGGDITSDASFGDFELELEWNVSEAGNSGIFYRVDERHGVWESAAEMQVLDDRRHPDGRNPVTSAGSCYGLIAPGRRTALPPGQWNRVRIVARGSSIEHWLNGERVLAYDTESDEWKSLVAASKFAGQPHFARAREGKIVLQDHGDRVAYRAIRVRRL